MAADGNAQTDPAVRADQEGRLYLHSMLAGYFEPDGTAVVDSGLFGTELNWFLLPRGKPIRWEDGVSQRLESADVRSRLAPVQQVRVYQLCAKAPSGLLFASFAELNRSGRSVEPEHYKLVYDGPCQGELDDICDTLTSAPPKGYLGRPLAVSDVLELSGGKLQGCFYIDHAQYVPLPLFLHRQEPENTWTQGMIP